MSGAKRERELVEVSPDWFEWRDKETGMYLSGFKTQTKAVQYGRWNEWLPEKETSIEAAGL